MLSIDSTSPESTLSKDVDVTRTIEAALTYFSRIQAPDGSWEGENEWSPVILAQYVITRSVLGNRIEGAERDGVIAHFKITQRSPVGWGLHPESGPFVYVTTLAYVALRLLGVGPNHELIQPARLWLREQQPEGVLSIPTWGKFWLSMLGLYEYEGINPIPPELILLPRWLGAHPDRWCAHTRYVFYAMSYLYGIRFRVSQGQIQKDLRDELYGQDYKQIRFASYRHSLSATDVFARPGKLAKLLFSFLSFFERCRNVLPGARWIRQKALRKCSLRISTEQRVSQYRALTSLNGLLNVLVLHSHGHSEEHQSMAGVEFYKWEDTERGIRYAGSRSNVWDTAFVLQAYSESPMVTSDGSSMLMSAYQYLQENQIQRQVHYSEDRNPVSIGGWCFGAAAHSWPVSDCTAEALCAILATDEHTGFVRLENRVPEEQLEQAIIFILSRQNKDGGFSAFELKRAGSWLETFNSSEMFAGSCMRDRSFVECTGSCLKALGHFRKIYPGRQIAAIKRAIERGRDYLIQQQRPDGSFEGSWGINFTYAAFFASEGLVAAGLPSNHPSRRALVRWLLQTQLPDGGWGEHFSSCLTGSYTPSRGSRVVMTAWATLALLCLRGTTDQNIQRAICWLQTRQQKDGSWPHEGVNGVFFGSGMLDYKLYDDYFALWAITRFSRMRGLRETELE